MSALILLLTVLTSIILVITAIAQAIRRKPFGKTAWWGIGILLAYSLAWGCFWLARRHPVIPFGTDVCFDDWCVTIDKVEQVSSTSRDSTAFVMVITMSNHARGIAQRPSEPRIHLIDDLGRTWTSAVSGPNALDARLALHESKTTTMKFVVPTNALRLTALIEEGPWITDLLLPEDQPVFKLR